MIWLAAIGIRIAADFDILNFFYQKFYYEQDLYFLTFRYDSNVMKY